MLIGLMQRNGDPVPIKGVFSPEHKRYRKHGAQSAGPDKEFHDESQGTSPLLNHIVQLHFRNICRELGWITLLKRSLSLNLLILCS